jgi:hypothetical protein
LFRSPPSSSENLREILGPQFPQERINQIIKEADLTEDNRISYPEFLALWEDKEESEVEDNYMVSRSNDDPEELTPQATKDLADSRVLMRADSDAESATISRANYIEGKKHSERRKAETAKIIPHAATKIVLNTVDEIVEDPDAPDTELAGESFDSLLGGEVENVGPPSIIDVQLAAAGPPRAVYPILETEGGNIPDIDAQLGLSFDDHASSRRSADI